MLSLVKQGAQYKGFWLASVRGAIIWSIVSAVAWHLSAGDYGEYFPITIKASMTGIAIGLQHEAIVLLSARACAGFTGHDTRFGSLRWRFILRWLSEFNQQSHFKCTYIKCARFKLQLDFQCQQHKCCDDRPRAGYVAQPGLAAQGYG